MDFITFAILEYALIAAIISIIYNKWFKNKRKKIEPTIKVTYDPNFSTLPKSSSTDSVVLPRTPPY